MLKHIKTITTILAIYRIHHVITVHRTPHPQNIVGSAVNAKAFLPGV